MDTVTIDADAARLTLVWRAALTCDKQALKVSVIRVAARRPAPGVAAPRNGAVAYGAASETAHSA
jgi:hypothetical protein